MTRFFRRFIKSLWYLCAYLIIILAILIQFGRMCVAHLDTFKQPIEQYLSEQSGTQVSVGIIRARWQGLRPEIHLDDVKLLGTEGKFLDQPLLSAAKVSVVFDLSETLTYLTPVFKKIAFTDLHLNLVQHSTGLWTVAGFAPKPSDGPSLFQWRYQTPADVFRTIRYGDLQNTRLTFYFEDDRKLNITVPKTSIQNNGDQHYLSASVDVDGVDVLSLAVHGKGDAYQPDSFSAQAYVAIADLPLEKLSDFVFWDKKSDKALLNASVDSKLWFDFSSPQTFSINGSMDFKPEVVAQKLSWPLKPENLLQQAVSATFSGQVDTANALVEIELSELDYAKVLPLAPAKLQLSENVVTASLESIDIADVRKWFSRKLSQDEVKKVVSSLSPQGQLNNLVIELPLSDTKNIKLQALARDVRVNSWNQLPAYKNISGYLNTGITRGYFVLDTSNFNLDIPSLYDSPLVFNTAKGQVDWEWQQNDNLFKLDVRNVYGDSQYGLSRGNFQVVTPTVVGSGKSEMALQLGVQNGRLSKLPSLLPKVLNAEVSDWLKSALKKGNLVNAGVIYRGGFRKSKENSFQLFADIKNTDFTYQPQWPQLDDVSGSLMVDNNFVAANIDEARMYDDVSIRGVVRFNPKRKSLLNIDLDVDASGDSSLRFVENSPLNKIAGDIIADWRLEGNVNYKAELIFPLGKTGEPFQSVKANLKDNNLILGDLNLRFDKLQGDFSYSTDEGFFTKNLLADFMGDQVVVDLETSEDEVFKFSGVGKVDVANVFDWLQQPLFNQFVLGKTNYNFELDLATQAKEDEAIAALSVYSDLKNAIIELPGQYKKYRTASADLLFNGQIFRGSSEYKIRLDDTVFAAVNIDDKNQLFSAINIDELASPEPIVPVDQGLKIKGKFLNTDVEEWVPFFTKLIEQSSESQSEPLPIIYDIESQSVNFDELIFTNVSVLGQGQGARWENTIASDTFAGNVFYNGEEELPLNIDIDYLLLPDGETSETEASETDVLAEVDPWQEFDFSSLIPTWAHIEFFQYGDKPLGEWAFEIMPNDQGVEISKINASFDEVNLSGLNEGQLGARLIWQKDEKGLHTTSFSGRIKGGSLKSLFEEWGLPPTLENQDLDSSVSLSWLGSPAYFDVNRTKGNVSFKLEKGSFIQQENNATVGILQLVNLINFDAWLRRLRFDFSDVSNKAIAYDKLSGELTLTEGLLTFTQPVSVESTSLSLALRGAVDNKQRTINGELDVVLPVGGNLNFAAALVAGLPAAVGVYLVRKLFQSEIEKASTLTYEVSGSLAKPDIKYINSSVE